MRLKGKTALIAGAARNIGKAIALTYAREGADVILVAREARDALDATAKECEGLGVKVLPLLADVGDHAQVEDVVKQGLKRFDKVEVLVSVAALRPHKPFWEISYEEWNRVLAVNLHSTFYFAKALAPSMMEKRNGGSIIALGGLASMTGQPIRAHVVASKTGLYGLIKALALELGPFGVTVNAVAPGFIVTEMTEATAKRVGVPFDEYQRLAAEQIPVRRVGVPQDIANVIAFLAGDEASFVSGQVIYVAGGPRD